jgi:hypothetical protein
MDELVRNVHDAIEGCLSVEIVEPKPGGKDRILEIVSRACPSHPRLAFFPQTWMRGTPARLRASSTRFCPRMTVNSPELKRPDAAK